MRLHQARPPTSSTSTAVADDTPTASEMTRAQSNGTTVSTDSTETSDDAVQLLKAHKAEVGAAAYVVFARLIVSLHRYLFAPGILCIRQC